MFNYQFEMMSSSVDCIVLRTKANKKEILLIKRGGNPYKGFWALPGGFIERHEYVIDAAIRELQEETSICLNNSSCKFLFFVDTPDRDIRQRTISFVHLFDCKDVDDVAAAGDDAVELQWFDFLDVVSGNIELAFDHQFILNKYYREYYVSSN